MIIFTLDICAATVWLTVTLTKVNPSTRRHMVYPWEPHKYLPSPYYICNGISLAASHIPIHPLLHSQWYVPNPSTHLPCWHGLLWHSSSSREQSKPPYPSGQSHTYLKNKGSNWKVRKRCRYMLTWITLALIQLQGTVQTTIPERTITHIPEK